MTLAQVPRRTPDYQAVASSFLAEEPLADAVLALDRYLSDRTPGATPDVTAQEVCDRAAVDPTDRAAVRALLDALGERLTQVTAGREEAFRSVLETYPPEQRFSLPALTEALWPALENLRQATPGGATAESVSRLVARHEPRLKDLFQRHSGRPALAWDATRRALTLRLPALFARYAAAMDRQEASLLARVSSHPEGVALLTALAGLVTLRMPVSTPMVCAGLGLVGFWGLAPVIARLRGHLKAVVLDALRQEGEAINTLADGPAPRTLAEVLAVARPVLRTAVLGGIDDPADLCVHLAPILARFRDAVTVPGGPGAAYADAVTEVVRAKYTPHYARIVCAERDAAESSILTRLVSDPRGAGFAATAVTMPLSIMAARATPLGVWDTPLMAALFFAGGYLFATILGSTARRATGLDRAMKQEEALLAGLYTAAPSVGSSLTD
jgi:hypothetical protein